MRLSEEFLFLPDDHQQNYQLYADLDLTPIYDPEEVEPSNCSVAMVGVFPPDIFTDEERIKFGAVVLHFFATLYSFLGFAIVCDKYFFPSVQQLTQGLHLKSDIAGATLLGWVTSTPELFTSIIGIFVMKGDMGVGTIVGSSTFNHLAILGAIGLSTPTPVELEVFGVNRDVAFYGMAVLALLVVLWDEIIFWYECIGLLFLYSLYITTMVFDTRLHHFVDSLFPPTSFCCFSKKRSKVERSSLSPSDDSKVRSLLPKTISQVTLLTLVTSTTFSISENPSGGSQNLGEQINSNNNGASCGGTLRRRMLRVKGFVWRGGAGCVRGASVPLNWIFFATIPTWSKSSSILRVLLAFLASTFWISLLSYLSSWMMAIVGYTYRVNDTVFGLSLIAAGTSLPEALSSVILARRGQGTMGVSNGVGSNTFNILICLSIPWLLRGLIDGVGFARVGSFALSYSTGLCGVSIILIHVILASNHFVIDTKVASFSFLIYFGCVTLDSLIQLNVLVQVNLPICD